MVLWRTLLGPSRCPKYRTLFGASGDPYRGCLEGPHGTVLWSTPKVLQSTTYKVLGSTPLFLWNTLFPLVDASYICILWLWGGGGPSGHLFPVVGASWDLNHWLKGPSWLEGALRDLTQFGVLCSVIGGANLWCHWCIMISKQTN